MLQNCFSLRMSFRDTFWNIRCLFPAGNYMFKVNNRKDGVVLVSLLLTLTYFTPCSSVSIVTFDQVNAGCLLFEVLNLFLAIPPFYTLWKHQKTEGCKIGAFSINWLNPVKWEDLCPLVTRRGWEKGNRSVVAVICSCLWEWV